MFYSSLIIMAHIQPRGLFDALETGEGEFIVVMYNSIVVWEAVCDRQWYC